MICCENIVDVALLICFSRYHLVFYNSRLLVKL